MKAGRYPVATQSGTSISKIFEENQSVTERRTPGFKAWYIRWEVAAVVLIAIPRVSVTLESNIAYNRF